MTISQKDRLLLRETAKRCAEAAASAGRFQNAPASFHPH